MPDKQIKYFRAANAGVELVKSEDSRLSYPLHNHVSTFTVGMILSGAIQLTLGGQKNRIVENQPFVIAPYIPHSIRASSKYSMICLCVHKEIINNVEENRLVSLVTSILNATYGGKQLDVNQINLLLNALLLCKRFQNTHVAGINYVERLKQLIEQCPEHGFTVEEMSRYTRVSKYHLIRSFKQEIGMTPRQFQIQNRIRKAQRMLTKPLSMTETAQNAGFFDQSHFIRHFKKIVGITPSSYKSALQLIQVLHN